MPRDDASARPVTTTIVNAPLFRLTIEPNSSNGLLRVGRAIALWLGLAG